jgi:hypothetical protein
MNQLKMLAVGLVGLMLSACGSDNYNQQYPQYGYNYGNNYNNNYNCPTNTLRTNAGCLPRSQCQNGMVLFNNSCMTVTQVNNIVSPNNGYNNGGYNTGYNNGGYNNGGYNNGGYNNGGYNNSCPTGSYLTNYGCLPQANCPNGQVFYQNRCYNLIQNNYSYNAGAGFQFYLQW